MGVIKHIFSNAIADGTNTAIVRPSDWNSSHAYTLQDAVSLGGNTSGALALISSGLLFLAGGSNVTLSQNGNSVTVSAADGLPLASSGNFARTGFTTTSVAGDQVAGTHDTAGMKIAVPAYLTTAQSPGAYLTTAALSNHSHGNPQLNLTNLSGTTASNSAGFTLSLSGPPPGGGAQTAISGVIASDATYTSGSVYFSGQNNLTVGSSVNGASQYVRLSVGAYITTGALSNHSHGNPQLNLTNLSGTTASNSAGFTLSLSGPAPGGGAQTAISGVVASDATYTSGTVIWSGQNNITIGSSVNGASQYVRLSVGPYITTAALSGDTTKYAGVGESVGTVAGTDLAMTVNTDGVSILYPKWITTAQAPGAYLTTAGLSQDSSKYAFTGFTTTTVAGAVVAGTHDTVGLKLAVPAFLTTAQPVGAYLTTARASNDAIGLNTALTANGVAWTVNSSGLSLNVPAFLTTAALSNHSHGNPTLNLTNLSGTTASNSAGLTLSLSAAAPGAAVEANPFNLLGVNTDGNTTATGSTIGLSGVNLTLSGTNNSQIVISAPATSSVVGAGGISISTAGSTMSISYSGIDRNMHELMDGDRLTVACGVTGGSYSKRPILMPFWLDGNSLQPRTVRFIVAPAAANASLNITMGVGFYSQANTSSLNLAFSTTNAFSLTTSAQWSGIRVMDITGFTNATHTLSEGRWVMALYVSGSNNSTVVMNLNFYGGDPFNNVGFILAGTNSTAATNSGSRFFPFWGVWNATTAAFPAAIAASSIAGGASVAQADIYAALLENAP